MDPQPSAPPVAAVVVTCDPGPWLEDTLSALAAQDYPNLSVLVIDAASTDDPAERVAAVLPTAYVRRLDRREGFGPAANEVLNIVEGASHLLFCHDDVAPATDAVRIMVEEAFRSNAGIVCPKLVQWDLPDRLLSVGQSCDKVGVPSALVERGELDQEQHDAVRDVFCAPSGFTLVRADLFATLGGYDPRIGLFGEDLNLSWRVQVAGARVVVAPEARVRHLEALSSGRREGWTGGAAVRRGSALTEEHRIYTLLTCYSLLHLIRVLPQALLLSVGQAVVELLSRRRREAVATLMAWPRAFGQGVAVWHAHRAVQAHRIISDKEIRRLQSRGSARIRSFFRTRFASDRLTPGSRGAAMAQSLRTRAWRPSALSWAILAVVLLIGSRRLLSGPLPGIGSLPVLTGGPSRWWRLWVSGWRPDGLGSTAPAPPALGLLALAGSVLLGGTGLLQRLLILGPLVVGPLGAYRAARPFGSPRGRAAALIVYGAVTVPHNALSGGRWAGLVLYGAAPWLLAGLLRTSGEAPFATATPDRRRLSVAVLGLGVVVALTAAFVPAALAVVPLMGAGLLVGSVLTGRLVGGVRAFFFALLATAIGFVLLLPWSADVVSGRDSFFGVPPGPSARLGLGRLLAGHTGQVGGPLAWGLVVAATLPLLVGRSWRLMWAARLWTVALACWGVVWAAGRGWIPVTLASPEVLLAPAAAALAGAVALGVVAFEIDLPGYRFGWRQLASTVAAIAVALGSLPVLGAAIGGRWHLPSRGLGDSLAFLADGRSQGPFRVLWVGYPGALPLGSWPLRAGIGYATSESGLPDVANQWPAASSGATPLLATDLRLAEAGLTTRLGHLLAPMAVRYIVIPNRVAPTDTGAPSLPAPQGVMTALSLQEDLRSLDTDQALTVYQNAAWAPERAIMPEAAVEPSHSSTPQAAQGAPLAGAKAALDAGGRDSYRGSLPAGTELLVAASNDGRWKLTVAGQAADSRPAFGWAMAFTVPGFGGPATLTYHTAAARMFELAAEIFLWLAALTAIVIGRRRRRAGPPGHAPGPSDQEVPPVVVRPPDREPSLVGVRRRPRRVVEPIGFDPADEEWV